MKKDRKEFFVIDKHCDFKKEIQKIRFLEQNDGEYLFDGDLWVEISPINYYEGMFVFMRKRDFSIEDVWEILITCSDDDNLIGAVNFIIKNQNIKEILLCYNLLKVLFKKNRNIMRNLKFLEKVVNFEIGYN